MRFVINLRKLIENLENRIFRNSKYKLEQEDGQRNLKLCGNKEENSMTGEEERKKCSLIFCLFGYFRSSFLDWVYRSFVQWGFFVVVVGYCGYCCCGCCWLATRVSHYEQSRCDGIEFKVIERYWYVWIENKNSFGDTICIDTTEI